MTYSCAIFPPQFEETYADAARDPLEQAQYRKLHRVLDLAQVQPGHRILEIGSGWASLSIEAAKRGCRVDTLTLSVEQQTLARERIEQACVSYRACRPTLDPKAYLQTLIMNISGFTDKITVHLMDYRKMPEEWKGAFDRVISIEMIEAVGLVRLNPLQRSHFHFVK